jgi:hydroxyacylglutathione hydrolase
MLEDDFTYVLRKALMGHGLAPAQAAMLAGLPENEVLSFLRGTFSPDTATRLAKGLRLNPEAFAKHDIYQPKPLAIPGIDRIDLPFKGERVNAWLVRSGGAIVLFDTGYEAKDLIDAVEAHCGRLPDRIFITHPHVDHVGAMDHYLAAGIPIHSNGLPGTIPMKPGDEVFCGALPIRACDLSGHANPALGFHIGGLEKPTLVTGDALFAGSMGGCASPEIYQLALGNLGIVLGPLPEETVILPGHGPTTTLGEERIANPFL